MNRSQYLRLHNYILAHPMLHRSVTLGVKILPGIVYVVYPLLLLHVLYFALLQGRWDILLRTFLVPLAGFLLCTILRAGINAPRPYEKLGIPAITHKDTRGKSFPSRHAACASVIAVTTLYLFRPLGIFLLVISVLIVISRVLAGVHFIRDVLTGWLLGAVIGYVGIFLI